MALGSITDQHPSPMDLNCQNLPMHSLYSRVVTPLYSQQLYLAGIDLGWLATGISSDALE